MNSSKSDNIFSNNQSIKDYDSELWLSFQKEAERQEDHIELIASENYASKRILEAQGSLLTNKYAEGYPSKRYYGGCENVDIAENLAKMAYNIPGVRQGNQTTQYLKQTVSRLAFMGGVFLAFLAFFPIILGNIFQFNIFKNLTSLIILIGVITDVTSQVKGYLVSQNYESFKKI